MKKIILLLIVFSFSFIFVDSSSQNKVSAISGADFQPGRIIDDAVFFNGDAMNTSQIQAFLNSKVTSCTSGHVCLKDYVMNTPQKNPESGLCSNLTAKTNQSAAKIINDVAKACGVSPKVILVLLQKEMGLVTRTAPTAWHYERATGYDCPDTDPPTCNPAHAGYFNQVFMAARVYKWYALNNGPNYRRHQNNFIQYNPNPGCGGSWVYLENQATAGLYNYTPYQPNPATLAVGLGVEAPCGAYGNKNFWWIYNLWFGSPINDAYVWEVIHETSVGKLYLVVNNKRHWIPNPTMLAAWGLDDQAYRDVDTAYVNQLAAGPTLTKVALDINGTRYLMSQGKKYRLKSDGYVLVWGVAGMNHISAPGLLSITPSGGDAGRFAKIPDGTIYLLNNYRKHLPLESDSFTDWGITTGNTTDILVSDIDHIPGGDPIGQFAVYTSSKKVIDRGKLLDYKNSYVAEGWADEAYVTAYPFASNLLQKATLGSFVSPVSNGKVYFVENGNHHYVPTPDHLTLWGMGKNNPLTTISDKLFSELTAASTLGHIVKSSSSGNTYLMAKKRYLLPNSNLETLYNGADSIPTFSSEGISTLPSGGSINSPLVKFTSDSKTYVLDDGKLRHVQSPDALDGLGGNRNNVVMNLPNSLRERYSSAGSVGYKLTDGTSTYYAENGYRYLIDSDFEHTWQMQNASLVSDELIAELTNSGQTLSAAVKIGSNKYLMNNGVFIDITNSYQTFGLSNSDFGFIFERYMPSTGVSGYFVQSMTGSKVYVLSYGKTYHISNPQTLLDLGYGVYSGVIKLHPEIMEGLLAEQPTKASRLVKSPSTGILFASVRSGFVMPNLSTLSEYKGTSQYMVIAPEFFNQFKIKGTASKLVNGTNGKIYAIDDNTKRWVTSPSALSANYPGVPVLKLPQSTIDGFSTGPNIN